MESDTGSRPASDLPGHPGAEAARVRQLNQLAILLQPGDAAPGLDAIAARAAFAAGAVLTAVVVLGERGGVEAGAHGPLTTEAVGALPLETLVSWAEGLAAGGSARAWPVDVVSVPGLHQTLARADIGYIAAAPVSIQGVPLGILAAGRASGHPFSDADLVTLDLAGTLVGESIVAQRRLRDEEDERRCQQALAELATTSDSGGDPETSWRRLYPILLRALDCAYAGLLLRDRDGRYRGMSSFADGTVQFGLFAGDEIGADFFDRETPVVYDPRHSPIPAVRARARMGLLECATVPLREDGEILGMLTAGGREQGTFDARRLDLLSYAAGILARVIVRDREVAAASQSARRHEALSRAALLLSNNAPLASNWAEVEALCAEATGCAQLSVILLERDDSCRAIGSAGGAVRERVVTARQGGLHLLRPGRLLVHGVANRRSWAVRAVAAQGAVEAIAVPLSEDDRVIGVLSAGFAAEGAIDAGVRHFLEVLGAFISRVAIARRALERSQREAEEQRVISAVTAAAAAEQDAGRTIAVLNERLAAFVPGVVTSFGFVEGGVIAFQGTDAAVPLRVRINPFIREALQLGQLAGPTFPLAEIDPVTGIEDDGIHASSLTTASASGEIVGALFVGSRDPGFAWDAQTLELLHVLARILGPVMANARATNRALREAAEQRVLARVTSAAATERDSARLIRRLASAVAAIVPGPIVTWAHIEGGELAWLTLTGELLREPVRRSIRHIIDGDGQLSVDEVDHRIFPEESEFRTLGAHAYSLTVARVGGDAVGLVAVASTVPGWTFGDRELELLRTIAGILGAAMARTRDADRIAFERVLYDTIVRSLSEAVLVFDHEHRPVFWNGHGQRLAAALRRYGDTLPAILPHLDDDAAAVIHAATAERRASSRRVRFDIDGEETWFDFEAIPLSHPSYSILIVATDATSKVHRERAELLHRAELAAAATRAERDRGIYNLTLESLSEAVILVGFDPADAGQLEVSFVNHAGRELAAVLEETSGGPLAAVADYQRALPAPVAEAFRRGLATHTGARSRTSLGSGAGTRWIDWEIVPLPAPLKLMLVGSDVTAEVERENTEDRHRQQLEQASRLVALGELIGGVAHELNNPLTAVLGFAEILAASPDAGPFREELQVIRKEAERARDVVRDLLFMARPGAAERAAVDLNDVVGHVERLKRAAWSRDGIAVTIDLAGVSAPVMANEHQLVQILLNLVTNAEHALRGRAGAAIRISGATGPDGACLAVEDNGPGMPPEVARRVFEPFFTTRPGIGNGLGLSLSYTIAASLDGRLDLATAPGEGACFTLTLPLTTAAPRTPAPHAAKTPRHLAFLVVDDEPNVRRVCERLITSMGHRCVTAPDSAAAAAAAAAEDFDVVLCDFRLCAETAADVVRALKEVRPRLLSRMVIATGATTEPGVEALRREYALRVLAKPYGLRDIAALAAEAAEAA
ncbi:MAG: GAF domain-containing protein [Dehalococcoidia bacterium]